MWFGFIVEMSPADASVTLSILIALAPRPFTLMVDAPVFVLLVVNHSSMNCV